MSNPHDESSFELARTTLEPVFTGLRSQTAEHELPALVKWAEVISGSYYDHGTDRCEPEIRCTRGHLWSRIPVPCYRNEKVY